MEYWIVIDTLSGIELSRGSGPEGAAASQSSPDGAAIIIVPSAVALSPSLWRFEDGAFFAQDTSVAVVVVPSLSRIAYQRLFTQAERIAIRASIDAIVIDFRELAALAETIELDDPDVVAGTQYLEALGLIGEGRAAAILAAQSPA